MTPAAGLARQQSKVLAYIRGYITEHGCSPSYAEIGAGLGVVPSCVHRHVHALAQRGHLTMRAKGACSIALTKADALVLHIPAVLKRELERLAAVAGVTPEAIAIEALRDCLLRDCSHSASRETSATEAPSWRAQPHS